MAELLVGVEELSLGAEEGSPKVTVKVRGAGVRLDYIERPEQEQELSPRENLLAHLQAAAAAIDPDGRQYRLPLLTVTMPCGNSKEYLTENNIPVVSERCTCKHSGHWFIKYVDAEGNMIMPAETKPKAAAKPKAKPKASGAKKS